MSYFYVKLLRVAILHHLFLLKREGGWKGLKEEQRSHNTVAHAVTVSQKPAAAVTTQHQSQHIAEGHESAHVSTYAQLSLTSMHIFKTCASLSHMFPVCKYLK